MIILDILKNLYFNLIICYNSAVKKLAIITMVASICFSATAINATAAIDDLVGEYPTNFLQTVEFSKLNDFALSDDTFAFADGSVLYVYSFVSANGYSYYGNVDAYEHSCDVTDVAFSNGELYFKSADDGVYSYSNEPIAAQYDFKNETSIQLDNYYYNVSTSESTKGQLAIFERNTNVSQTVEGNYSKLKLFDNAVYALADGSPVKFDGTQKKQLAFTYTDYSTTKSIATGNIFNKINDNYTFSVLSVKANKEITQVNLNDTQSDTFSVGNTIIPPSGTVAILIYRTDNLAIISIGGESYITHPDNVETIAYTPIEKDLNGGYTLSEIKIYSSPFISKATEVATLEKGTSVEVKSKLSHSALLTNFYLIEIDKDGTKISGYVASNNLSLYAFSGENNKENVISDKENYETNVQNVILVLVLVGLIIITIAYLTIVGTRSPKIKKGKEQYSEDEKQ